MTKVAMGFFDRLFGRREPPAETRDAVRMAEPIAVESEGIKRESPENTQRTVHTTPVGVGYEKIKRLFVCGKTDTNSPQYQAALQRVVSQAVEARRARLFLNQRVTTLIGSHMPD